MKRKIYLSNILRHWPVEAQRKALAGVEKPHETYEDILKPRHLKAHAAAALTERGMALRPTSRKGHEETIYVASLGVLAWVAEDFMAALGAVAARNASVVAMDTGRHISATATATELAEALSEFLAARRRHQTTGGRLAGVKASNASRKADTAARAALIAEDWRGVDVPTDVLLARAGRVPKGKRDKVAMAYRTAVLLLGRRQTPKRMRVAKLKREAENA